MLIYLQMIETEAERSRFEQLYRKYRGLMFCVANKVLNHVQDAEDAVHQAFVCIAENFSKVGEIESPQTQSYVVIIAEHKAIDLYRKKSKHASVELFEELSGVVVPEESDKTAGSAILQLPTRDREILLLRYDNGYSNTEVAKMLGLSLEAQRKAEQRAKARLKEILDKEDVTA